TSVGDALRAGDYDALADLFLGENGAARPAASSGASEASSPARPAPAAGPLVEGLILGHLPVLASAWVQQYARQLAMDHNGPVAPLRLRAGEASLEVIGSRLKEDCHQKPGLELALAEAAAHAVAWLLRVDETTEPRLPELPGFSAITLLTGADEAAVV